MIWNVYITGTISRSIHDILDINDHQVQCETFNSPKSLRIDALGEPILYGNSMDREGSDVNIFTLPKLNMEPEHFPIRKGKNIFQTSFFGFHVSFRVSMNWGFPKPWSTFVLNNGLWIFVEGNPIPRPQKVPTVTVRQDPIYEYLPRRGLDSDTYGRLKLIWMTPRPLMNMFLPRMSMQIVGAFFWGMCIWMNFQHVRPQMCPWQNFYRCIGFVSSCDFPNFTSRKKGPFLRHANMGVFSFIWWSKIATFTRPGGLTD